MRGEPGSVWAFVACVSLATLVGLWVRFNVIPAHHAMYLDEPWYAEASCNLAHQGALENCEHRWTGRACTPYRKAPGWPLVLSVPAKLFGCRSSLGIEVNRLLGTASVPLLALASIGLGISWWPAGLGSWILAVHPVHAEWSATGETNVAAAFALLLGVCALLHYRLNRRRSLALVGVTSTAFSVLLRPENLLVAMALTLSVTLCRSLPPRRRTMLALALASLSALAFVPAASLWSMNEAISGGAFLSLSNITQSFRTLGQQGGWQIHGLVAAAAAVGVARLGQSSRTWEATLVAGLSLAGIASVVAYDRFAPRMILVATVTMLAACGAILDAPRRKGFVSWSTVPAAAIVLSVFWRGHLQAAARPSETQLLETRSVQSVTRATWPADGLFIAEQPAVLTASGFKRVMSTREALSNRAELSYAVQELPVFFFDDMYCEDGFRGGGSPERCRDLTRAFSSSEVLSVGLHSRRYSVLRLTRAVGTRTTGERSSDASNGSLD